MKHCSENQRGFTLTEMLVVLSVLALITAVSLPFARSTTEARKFDATARSLVALLQEAHLQALATGRDVTVSFDTKARTFTNSARNASISVPHDAEVRLLGLGGHAPSKDLSYVFFALGGSSGGKLVISSKGKTHAICLNWLTAAITTQACEAGDVAQQ